MLIINQEKKINIKYLKSLSTNLDEGVDVIQGLTSIPKSLPSKYFYDRLGSELFEKICDLPEYYPTRTETSILMTASQEIAEITGICELVELGSGSSTKTRLLLSAYDSLGKSWQYVPIDVSSEILKNSALQLHEEYDNLSILGLAGTYEQALLQLPISSLPQRMIIFLGSTLGNFTYEQSDELFNEVRDILQVGDYFLLGIDLQKSVNILENAYNDSRGITAAFNLNMLSHLNACFDGNFDINLFKHQAIYNQENQQIEMYLYAQKNHEVRLDKLDLNINFQENEPVLTEISRKFNLNQMQEFLNNHQLKTIKYWTDKDNYFGLILTQLI
ncbi:ABC transporter ATP-binding protein [Geminocystis sp. NIES-3708]|uniref:L-histidine N(alpha)-methyltransferase n=1 Tax=Geminocystis sp. NIES-3708 TaxID=1615909 RepID=UPI0005FCCEDB|nr:L-histidine N(alpha)-methyltransferase [Geminocystis sp. NIES-3708]BAQ59744.1 ABC transporter ATP-binding protein [Geminocystis sp. NIES-3708]